MSSLTAALQANMITVLKKTVKVVTSFSEE